MNAMFVPAVATPALPRATSIPFSLASLSQMHFRRSGRPDPSEYSCVVGSASAARAASIVAGNGPIVDDPLAQRNGPRDLSNNVSHHRNDGCLDAVHPRHGTYVLHA